MTWDEYLEKVQDVLKAVRSTGVVHAEVFDQSFENGDCLIKVGIAHWSEMELEEPDAP